MKKLFENWRRFTEQEEETPWSVDPETEAAAEEERLAKKAAETPPPATDVDSGEREGQETGIKSGNLGYVLGTIDGQVLTMHNENKLFYGASTPKPIFALANLIKCSLSPESGRCLTGDELRALLNYTLPKGAEKKDYWHGGDSNKVNRALTARQARELENGVLIGGQKGMKDKGTHKASKELARFKNNQETSKFLASLGLPDMKIRYGSSNNQQTPLGYYNFMRLLLDPDLQNVAGDIAPAVSSAVHEILNYMQRKHGILKTDREHSERFLGHLKYMQKKGLDVKSIYGKGGYYKKANNSAMILDNEYILVVYTDSRWAGGGKIRKDKAGEIIRNKKGEPKIKLNRAKRTRVNDLSDIIYQILKGSGEY